MASAHSFSHTPACLSATTQPGPASVARDLPWPGPFVFREVAPGQRRIHRLRRDAGAGHRHARISIGDSPGHDLADDCRDAFHRQRGPHQDAHAATSDSGRGRQAPRLFDGIQRGNLERKLYRPHEQARNGVVYVRARGSARDGDVDQRPAVRTNAIAVR
jgi:hypothetical protein